MVISKALYGTRLHVGWLNKLQSAKNASSAHVYCHRKTSGVMFDDPAGVWPGTDFPQSRLVGVNSVFVTIHATDLCQ